MLVLAIICFQRLFVNSNTTNGNQKGKTLSQYSNRMSLKSCNVFPWTAQFLQGCCMVLGFQKCFKHCPKEFHSSKSFQSHRVAKICSLDPYPSFKIILVTICSPTPQFSLSFRGRQFYQSWCSWEIYSLWLCLKPLVQVVINHVAESVTW